MKKRTNHQSRPIACKQSTSEDLTERIVQIEVKVKWLSAEVKESGWRTARVVHCHSAQVQ